MPQSDSSAQSSAGVTPQAREVKFFWHPDHLTLQAKQKQSVKLFFNRHGAVRLADDCTGRVAIGQIGFARVKEYRINIYQAVALRGGPFRCAVVAKIVGRHLRTLLHVEVAE